jgi:hypothetical protein
MPEARRGLLEIIAPHSNGGVGAGLPTFSMQCVLPHTTRETVSFYTLRDPRSGALRRGRMKRRLPQVALFDGERGERWLH